MCVWFRWLLFLTLQFEWWLVFGANSYVQFNGGTSFQWWNYNRTAPFGVQCSRQCVFCGPFLLWIVGSSTRIFIRSHSCCLVAGFNTHFFRFILSSFFFATIQTLCTLSSSGVSCKTYRKYERVWISAWCATNILNRSYCLIHYPNNKLLLPTAKYLSTNGTESTCDVCLKTSWDLLLSHLLILNASFWKMRPGSPVYLSASFFSYLVYQMLLHHTQYLCTHETTSIWTMSAKKKRIYITA